MWLLSLDARRIGGRQTQRPPAHGGTLTGRGLRAPPRDWGVVSLPHRFLIVCRSGKSGKLGQKYSKQRSRSQASAAPFSIQPPGWYPTLRRCQRPRGSLLSPGPALLMGKQLPDRTTSNSKKRHRSRGSPDTRPLHGLCSGPLSPDERTCYTSLRAPVRANGAKVSKALVSRAQGLSRARASATPPKLVRTEQQHLPASDAGKTENLHGGSG